MGYRSHVVACAFLGIAGGIAGCVQAAGETGRVTTFLEGDDDGGDASSDSSTDTGTSSDSGSDSDSGPEIAPSCDRAKPFNMPTPVLGFDERDVLSARLSADEKSALLSIANGGGSGGVDFFNASRATTADPFVIGAPITELNTAHDDYWPSLSADGKMLFFETAQPLADGGSINPRIWTATRPTVNAAFGPPTVLGIFRVDQPEAAPYLHPNGRSLYFASGARGGEGNLDLFVAHLTDFGVVTSVENLASANSDGEDHLPVVSYDERALFFTRYGSTSVRDIWVVGRNTATDPFGVPQEVVEVSSSYDEYPSSISPDGCRLYFISNRPLDGGQHYRVWVAQKPM